MLAMHPELRNGLAEAHVERLAHDRSRPSAPGPARRLAARLLLAASARLAGDPIRPVQASSASFTSLSASSLCSRRTAVYDTEPNSRPSRAA